MEAATGHRKMTWRDRCRAAGSRSGLPVMLRFHARAVSPGTWDPSSCIRDRWSILYSHARERGADPVTPSGPLSCSIRLTPCAPTLPVKVEGMSRGLGRVYQRGSVWWLDYTVGGQRHREPTDAGTKRDAQDILRERIGNRKSGKVFGRPDRIMVAEYVKGEDGKEKLSGGLRWLPGGRYDLAE